MPEEVKKVSPQVLAKLQAMQRQIQVYIEGVSDGMGLEWQYNVNLQTGELILVSPVKATQKEANG